MCSFFCKDNTIFSYFLKKYIKILFFCCIYLLQMEKKAIFACDM